MSALEEHEIARLKRELEEARAEVARLRFEAKTSEGYRRPDLDAMRLVADLTAARDVAISRAEKAEALLLRWILRAPLDLWAKREETEALLRARGVLP